tara:strand:- start:662 stop:1585 length:924 start_codon:yes stop_codon:yes gene_type:complete
MTCKKCKEKPVIKLTNSHITLCKKCFTNYFEKKVKKTIRNHKLFKKGDKVGVALSGGKDSLTTLHILNKIAKQQRTTKLVAITIDEGIKGYRDKTLIFAKKYCKENDIELHIASYKETFGKKLDSIVKKTDTIPCSICGVFRRYLLNSKAKELKVNKLATGHNLDDEAQTILMNQFRNNLTVSARLGPITGLSDNKNFIRRIKPLYFVTEKEVMTYAYLNKLSTDFSECPYSHLNYRSKMRNFINQMEEIYSGSKHGIVNSFLEILPELKEKYTKENKSIKECEICGEPTSKEKCQTCIYAEKIKNG